MASPPLTPLPSGSLLVGTEPTASKALSVALLDTASDSSAARPQCRICLEADRPGSLVAPCSTCTGTAKWVHPECLERWRSLAPARAFECEVCRTPFDGSVRPPELAPATFPRRPEPPREAPVRRWCRRAGTWPSSLLVCSLVVVVLCGMFVVSSRWKVQDRGGVYAAVSDHHEDALVHSVVVVLAVSVRGTLGVVVNRGLWGGPIRRGAFGLLWFSGTLPSDYTEVPDVPGLAWTATVHPTPPPHRTVLGHMGWSAGKLTEEVENNRWKRLESVSASDLDVEDMWATLTSRDAGD
eukprot:TRINITY_DN10404_c0_g1_i1.p1 TRINITY_DN10404_c0_g1~~TRINITY_DN10404_c0_g1_i1.p1  ORF type:complete len:296 (+),score=41.87 TRINITY_DN10404_c0_g1_i1:76-963(+)